MQYMVLFSHRTVQLPVGGRWVPAVSATGRLGVLMSYNQAKTFKYLPLYGAYIKKVSKSPL